MKHFFLLMLGVCLSVELAAEDVPQVGKNDRVSSALTVYNNDFGVVFDTRRITLDEAAVSLEVVDLVRSLQPESVTLRSNQARGFAATVQTFRFDLLDRQALLDRFVGRKIKYSRTLLEGGQFENLLREGVLLSINPEIVRFGDVVEIEPEGTISLPSLPADLTTIPTLIFQGENNYQGTQDLTLRYLAEGLSWQADYTLALGDKANLEGWVTVNNDSGSAINIDSLTLVAGDVAREQHRGMPMLRAQAPEMSADSLSHVESRSIGDFHQYVIDAPVALHKNDQTQLKLMEAPDIDLVKTYRLKSKVQPFSVGGVERSAPEILLSFLNNERNQLGRPLPAGTVRVFDRSRSPETFIGEARIGHRPVGTDVELVTGRAFDISVKRSQTDFRRINDRRVEVTYELRVANASGRRVTVELEELMPGEWQLLEASDVSERRPGNRLVFTKSVSAESEALLSYRVRLGW